MSRSRAVALIASTLVLASVAGFSVANLRFATTSSAALTAGSLAIADSDGGAQLFALTGMRPGDSQSRCVTVTNTGSLSYGGLELSAALTGTGLGDYLDVDVDRGSGAAAGPAFSCAGFVLQAADLFIGKLSEFEAASPVQDIDGAAAGQTISYRVAISMPADVSLASQGRSVQLALSWTAGS